MPADAVILSAATLAAENGELASMLKIQSSPDGFFIEAHAKLRPVDFSTEGLYMCGMAHGPKLITESIAQALAAASRAGAFLAAKDQTIGGVVAKVQPDLCAACLVCVRIVPLRGPADSRTTSRKSTRRSARGAAHVYRNARQKPSNSPTTLTTRS